MADIYQPHDLDEFTEHAEYEVFSKRRSDWFFDGAFQTEAAARDDIRRAREHGESGQWQIHSVIRRVVARVSIHEEEKG